jgi:hypothetical protein
MTTELKEVPIYRLETRVDLDAMRRLESQVKEAQK